MILRVEPIAAALEAIAAARGPSRRILLTPRGRAASIRRARAALAARPRLTLVCGRYEGIDERVAGRWSTRSCASATSSWRAASWRRRSVHRGGRAPGPGRARLRRCRPATSRSRRAPRVPAVDAPRRAGRARRVPEVLLSGDHPAIARWRRREALRRRKRRRPDLLAAHPLTDEERRLARGVRTTGRPDSEDFRQARSLDSRRRAV